MQQSLVHSDSEVPLDRQCEELPPGGRGGPVTDSRRSRGQIPSSIVFVASDSTLKELQLFSRLMSEEDGEINVLLDG